MAEWYEFAAPQLLAAALAEAVASRLTEALEQRGNAVLAVSGGSTPAMFFRALARKPIDWKSVTVLLVDERFVPPSSERSNERLVTLNLLQADAAAAHFVGLHSPGDIDEAVARADAEIASLKPFDAVVLGMGLDGHTASLFPDAHGIAAMLDPQSERNVYAVRSPSAGDDRITLSLAAISSAGRIFVHIEGLEKKERLLDILSDAENLPISKVIEQSGAPVDIYWAPGEPK